MKFKLEKELYAPIEKFLQDKHHQCTREVSFYDRKIDIVAQNKSNNEVTAIELKMKEWKKAMQQAFIYSTVADYVYVAMPAAKTKLIDVGKYMELGIGVLAIFDSEEVEVLLPAIKNLNISYKFKDGKF